MTKIKLELEVYVDDSLYNIKDRKEREWLTSILLREDELSLYSSEIGDDIGFITNVKNIEYEF